MDDHEKQALRDLDRDVKKLSEEVQSMKIKTVIIENSVESLIKAVEKLVSIDRFTPVQYIAYGLAGGVLTSALGAIMSMVFIK